MPTIRIDEEVWGWLQSKARPFEDTPNSVLRRIAGFGETPGAVSASAGSSPPQRPKAGNPTYPPPKAPGAGQRITGDQLNRKFRLGAQHALYHKDGTFYERLTRFPAVYCEPRGFVRFRTQHDFTSDRHLNIGQKVNVPAGLASHPKFERFPKA